MMFQKIGVFDERPQPSSVPPQLHMLSEAERASKLDAIYAWADKKQVERWLNLDRKWTFGSLQPVHPQLYLANALISSAIDLWPGNDFFSLSTYFIPAKDWEVSLVHAFAEFLTSDDETHAKSIADTFSFGADQFAIRAKLSRLQDAWRVFEAKAVAFISAMEAFKRGPDNVHPILQTLHQMTTPDVVLWHDIVTNMGHLNPDRVNAIEWIFSRPECDQATVAGFLHVAIEFAMWEEIQSYDNGQFDRLIAVINKWNAGFYQNCNLTPHDENNGVIVKTTAFHAIYPLFWKAICPQHPEQLPIPASKVLDKPSKSALLKYAKPSGFVYSPEHEALLYTKGRPQKRTYFPVS